MKTRKQGQSFLEQLKETMEELRRMKPGEVHILSIHANYGNYQIVIGPENGDHHHREIKVDGHVHHLFVSEDDIRPHPTREQVMHNMKNMVIMRKLHIHFHDPDGDGAHMMDDDGIYAQEYINLAGEMGKRLVMNAVRNREMSLAAYRIIQEDILSALKKEKRN